MTPFKTSYTLPFKADPKFKTRVAYFSMEFAIHQALKIYSGGLGFLAGSHMRSAYSLKQNMVGIGLLWKYGYYDQVRRGDKTMDVLFQEKLYSFLEDTGITFSLNINNHPVQVKAYYLAPEVFNSAPIFLLSTDLPENDYLAQTITHHLYDSNVSTRIAQYILLGIGGAKLMDLLDWKPQIYHLNEAHALPAAYYLYSKFKHKKSEVQQRLVLTTHTPEEAGNEIHDFGMLYKMGFFHDLSYETAHKLNLQQGENFNHTLAGLRLAKKANGVSKKHGEVARHMWGGYDGICEITHITNAQNDDFWADKELYTSLGEGLEAWKARKQVMKKEFFQVIADQAGKLFDPKVLTLVWARRFASYKRPDLITDDMERFLRMVNNIKQPIQIVWAGKPFPQDLAAIGTFNNLVHMNKSIRTASILVGYELALSRLCKMGADIWLNNPRVPREASGTSGMTAAMNGALNVSTMDGWMLEFGKHKENSFLVPLVDQSLPIHEQDRIDGDNLMTLLEKDVIPMYYNAPDQWFNMVKSSMNGVLEYFDSDRMATEYYELMYS